MKFKKLRKTLEDMGFIFNDYTYTTPNYFTSRYCIEFLKDKKTVLEIKKRKICINASVGRKRGCKSPLLYFKKKYKIFNFED